MADFPDALIACIIPTRNDLAHLPRAVNSVLASHPRAVAIVVNDASTDGTAAWLDACRTNPRVIGISLATNVGVGAARNLGLAVAATPFVTFLDSDDVHVPGFYGHALELLERVPPAAAVLGDFELVDLPNDITLAPQDPRLDAIRHSVVWTLVLRTAAVRAMGGFAVNEFFKVTMFDDYVFNESVRRWFDVVVTRRVACRHTVRAGGHTHSFLRRTRLVPGGWQFTHLRLEEADGSYLREFNAYFERVRASLRECQGLPREQGRLMLLAEPLDPRALSRAGPPLAAMKAYVVNLRRQPDRRQRMAAMLPDGLEVAFTSDWSGPFDGKQLDAAALKGYRLFPWKTDSTNKWWNRPLRKGQIGCAISHLRCWQVAWQSGKEFSLVFEDDAVVVDGFWEALPARLATLNATDPGWEFAYLGRLRMEYDVPNSLGVARPGFSYCAFAYVVRRSGLAKLLSAGFERAIIPVDEFLPAMYMDHPRPDVRRRFPKRLTALAFEPAIAFQRPKADAGSETEASDFWDLETLVDTSELVALAREDAQAGKWDDAAFICRTVLANQPSNADAWHLLGLALYASGDDVNPVECLSQAILLNPSVPSFHAKLGLALLRQRRLAEALAACTRALELSPDYPGAHNNLGLVLVERGELARAAAAFERAVALDPGFAEAWNNLGGALLRLGETSRAEACFQQAIALRPQLAAAREQLARTMQPAS